MLVWATPRASGAPPADPISHAFPPFFNTERPTVEAVGWDVATMPDRDMIGDLPGN